jgi:hypothetical protein
MGRSACFRYELEDVPASTSPEVAQNDLLPQFGYVGKHYEQRRVLLLAINPGNGPRQYQNAGDTVVMPFLQQFATERSPEAFMAAQNAYRSVCQGWLIWGRECGAVLQAGNITLDDIAFSNALPWRTGKESRFSKYTARCAATVYAGPLIDELQPNVIVAVGKRVAEVLTYSGHMSDSVVVWNRERAPKPHVLLEREAAKVKLANLLSHNIAA